MKDCKHPYFLDETLLDAVRDYLDQYIDVTPDLNEMTNFILDNYDQFASRSVKTFKPSVKKAYDHVLDSMKVPKKRRNRVKKRLHPADVTYAPILSTIITSTNDCSPKSSVRDFSTVMHCTPKKSPNYRDLSPYPEIVQSVKKQERHPETTAASSDFFVIDLDGCDADSAPTAEEVSIIDPPGTLQAVQPEISIEKKLTKTRTPVSSVQRKRKALEAEMETLVKEKQAKKCLLAKYSNDAVTNVTFADLGGLEPIRKLVVSVLKRLRNPPPLRRPITLLLSGPPGVGKTALATAMAESARLPLLSVRVGENLSSLSPEKKLLEELAQAVTTRPALVLVTEMDKLWQDSAGSRQTCEALRSVVYRILRCLNSETCIEPLLVVVETCETLDSQLVKCCVRHVVIKPPTAAQREDILTRVVSRSWAPICPLVELGRVALRCSGYLAGDLATLVEGAREAAIDRVNAAEDVSSLSELSSLEDLPIQVTITEADLIQAAKLIQPVLKTKGFPAVPDTTWADVGGLHSIREELRLKVLDPIREPDLWAKYDKTSSGILLWGPPGCGKTLLAKAVANEAGINLLIVNGPDLLSMYQGESERAVRTVFARAASVAPCVIFFDEFDSLCPRRSKTGSESGSKSTIVNTLLTEMSGFVSRSGVYLLAATNLPDVLDPAVLRPGRFDTKLYVGLPDQAGRLAVLLAATKHGRLPQLASDVDLPWVASECLHFSGADCRNLVDTASTLAIEELRRWRTAEDRHQREEEKREEDRHQQGEEKSEEDRHQQGEEKREEENRHQSGDEKSEEEDRHQWGEEKSEDERMEQREQGIGKDEEIIEQLGLQSEERQTEVTIEKSRASQPMEQEEQTEENFNMLTATEVTDVSTVGLEVYTEINNPLVSNEPRSSPSHESAATQAVPVEAPQADLDGNTSSITTPTAFTDVASVQLHLPTRSPFSEGEYLVYARHFRTALRMVKPSVSEKERLKYEEQHRNNLLER